MRLRFIIFITELLEKYFFTPKLIVSLQKAIDVSSNYIKSKDNLVIFDVGANTGQSINFFINNFSHESIFAFEPDQEVFDKLMNFSEKKGVFLNNFALGDKNGRTSFYTSPLTLTSSLLLPNHDSIWGKRKNRILGLSEDNSYKEIEVEIRTLDSFIKLNSINKIDILKIDVEGAELQVLNGAIESLASKKIKIIQVEVHYNDLRVSTHEEIDALLNKFHYSKFDEIKHSFGNFSDVIYL
jgi:FkbM family methyltransferase